MPRSKLAELLLALAALFRRRRLRWYVFGAQAANAYGRPRMTVDVDVTVDLGKRPLDPFVAALRRAGFHPTVEDLTGFISRTRVIPLVHKKTRIPIDLVLAGEGLEQTFLERAEVLDLGGARVPVLSAEDVLITKCLAGRPTDLVDVKNVLSVQGSKLDLHYVRQVLGELEEALGDTQLLSRLEGIRRKL